MNVNLLEDKSTIPPERVSDYVRTTYNHAVHSASVCVLLASLYKVVSVVYVSSVITCEV